MQLTKEEGRDIVRNYNKQWKRIEKNLVDHDRWSISYEGVFQHLPTNKFYMLFWSQGATECQDEQPFENDDPEPVEVELVEKVVQVYVQVKKE